jgi:hypothetical protein
MASHYLIRVYLSTGFQLSGLDFEKILDDAIAAGSPSPRRAALVGVWLRLDDRYANRPPGWYNRIDARLRTKTEKDVLHSERKRAN